MNEIEDATQLVRMAAINNKDIYNSFVASVEGALRDCIVVWEDEEYHDIAIRVTDRIIDKI